MRKELPCMDSSQTIRLPAGLTQTAVKVEIQQQTTDIPSELPSSPLHNSLDKTPFDAPWVWTSCWGWIWVSFLGSSPSFIRIYVRLHRISRWSERSTWNLSRCPSHSSKHPLLRYLEQIRGQFDIDQWITWLVCPSRRSARRSGRWALWSLACSTHHSEHSTSP